MAKWNSRTRKLKIRKVIDELSSKSWPHRKALEAMDVNNRVGFTDPRIANRTLKKLMRAGGEPFFCGDCACLSVVMPAKDGTSPYAVSVLHMG